MASQQAAASDEARGKQPRFQSNRPRASRLSGKDVGPIIVMCLMLYIATSAQVPAMVWGAMSVQAVDTEIDADVAQAFTRPVRSFVGADGGCSCDFPYVLCDEVFDYYEGMFEHDSPSERSHAVACVAGLLDLLRKLLEIEGLVEVFPAWAGEEALAPKGRVELRLQDVVAEQFFFVERFLYVVRP